MKVLYFDMDGVLVDFKSGIDQLTPEEHIEYAGRYDEAPHIFSKMKPLKGAIEAVEVLSRYFDCYILSTSPWENPTAASDKQNWIKKYFPKIFYKRMILSHRKDLLKGDYLIDDRPDNGAQDFEGEWIEFGSDKFPNWETVVNYLVENDMTSDHSSLLDNYMLDFSNTMMDFVDSNEEYVRLYDYSLNSDIYDEIRDYLDIAHPEWRKNKELGRYLPEFYLSIIDMYEGSEDEYTPKEWLARMYEETEYEYGVFKRANEFYRRSDLEKEFQDAHGTEDLYDSKEEYEEAYKEWKEKNGEEVFWGFE